MINSTAFWLWCRVSTYQLKASFVLVQLPCCSLLPIARFLLDFFFWSIKSFSFGNCFDNKVSLRTWLSFCFVLFVKVFLSSSSDLEVHVRVDALDVASFQGNSFTERWTSSWIISSGSSKISAFSTALSIAAPSTASLYASSLAAANSLRYFLSIQQVFQLLRRCLLQAHRQELELL